MKTIYSTKALSSGGRDGSVKTADGLLDLKLALPKELGGKGGAVNPEQLFAAGYAACFENALIFIARGQKLNPGKTGVAATVSLLDNGSGGFDLAVKLEVSLPDLQKSDAENLIQAAHKVCPYSNAIRNNIEVSLSLVNQS